MCNHRPTFSKFYFSTNNILSVSSIKKEHFKCAKCGIDIKISYKYVFFIALLRVLRCIVPLFFPLLFICFLITTNNTDMAIANRYCVSAVFFLSYFVIEFIFELLILKKIKFENTDDGTMSSDEK